MTRRGVMQPSVNCLPFTVSCLLSSVHGLPRGPKDGAADAVDKYIERPEG